MLHSTPPKIGQIIALFHTTAMGISGCGVRDCNEQSGNGIGSCKKVVRTALTQWNRLSAPDWTNLRELITGRRRCFHGFTRYTKLSTCRAKCRAGNHALT